MRLLVLFAILIVSAGCSNQKLHDPSESDPSLATNAELDSTTGTFFGEYDDTLQLTFASAIDDVANAARERSVYSLKGIFAGYENAAEAVYYFDSSLSLTYCTVAWTSEANSGSFNYYFSNDSLVAGREENAYNDFEELVLLHTKYHPIYGLSTTNGSEDDSGVTYLSEGEFISRRKTSREEYDRLVERIKEFQHSVSIEGDFVTIRHENLVNYGEDFTEREDYRMSKTIFEKLVRQ
jgi:hypothetical protein